MQSDPDKCHLLVSSCKNIKMKINDFEIENSTCRKFLRVHFDQGYVKKVVRNYCTSKNQSMHELM